MSSSFFRRAVIILLVFIVSITVIFVVYDFIKKNRKEEISVKTNQEKLAYDTWIKKGNNGTETDFLNWIKKASVSDATKEKEEEQEKTQSVVIPEQKREEKVVYRTKWLYKESPNVGSLNLEKETPKAEEKPQENLGYKIWLAEGNTGTETDFLNWIKVASKKPSNEVPPSIFDKVKFPSLTVVYDGLPHVVTATNVPEGTEVYYSDHTAVDVGTYKAFVSLNKDGITELMTTTLTIKKADIKNITFADEDFIYDGTVKQIAVSDNVPEGVGVQYTVNEVPFEGAKDVGHYHVTATLSGNNYNIMIKEAVLSIKKADIEEITFTDTSFVYDGTVKQIAVSDNVPEGVEVQYTVNEVPFEGEKDVGHYLVTAVLSSKNYNTLTCEASFEIIRADIQGISFHSAKFFEDGQNKNILVEGTIPNEVTVTYTMNEAPFSGALEVGTYQITATLEGNNYNTLTLTASITIEKNKIEGITFTSKSVQYQKGVIQNIYVEGNLPKGVTVLYKERWGNEFHGASEIRVYHIVATLTGKYHETLVLEAELIITPEVLDTVTGVRLEQEGNPSRAVLKWDAVAESGGYQVNVYQEDRTLIQTYPIARRVTTFALELTMVTGGIRYYSGNYIAEVIAIPAEGNATYSASLPSLPVIYSHEGVLRTPQNVHFEDNLLVWDPVSGADIFGIRVATCDSDGNILSMRTINYAYAKRSIPIAIELLKEDLELSSGYYMFAVCATPASGGTENSTNPVPSASFKSDFSEYTELIRIE